MRDVSIAIVTGGRDKRDKDAAFAALDEIDADRGISVVIEGGQRTYDDRGNIIGGADWFAYQWALYRQKGWICVEADWEKHGRAAGPIRNGSMLKVKNLSFVVNMTGGRGTVDMVRQAHAAGIEIINAPIN